MRVKTDSRRQAILSAALAVFRDVGYERASMAAISARVGGSKATLYAYFKSKEELFAAAMLAEMEVQGQRAIDMLDASQPDVASVLCRFGDAYLALVTSPGSLAILRTAIAQGAHSSLGAMLYESGAERAWDQIGAYLAGLQDKGVLRGADPRILKAHLKGLLEAGVFEPQLFGAKPWLEKHEAVAAAVDAFLRAYRAA